MSFFADLSKYSYTTVPSEEVVNVGWLGDAHTFEQESPTHEFLDALWEYCKISVAATRGLHPCKLCPAADSTQSVVGSRHGERLLLGSAQIRVFGKNKRLYASPTLIYHYVERHSYRPPDEFIVAVLQTGGCPSKAYFDRLEAAGIRYERTHPAPPAVKPIRLGSPDR